MKKSFENMHKVSKDVFMRYPDEFVVRFFAKRDFSPVLDFGCSNGRHTQMFFDLGGQKEIYALDLDDEVLKIVEKRVPKAMILKPKDISKIPKASLKSILAWHSLYMNPIKKQEKLLKSFATLLAGDGVLLSSYRAFDDSYNNASCRNQAGVKLYFYKLKKIKALYKKCGFEIENIYKQKTLDTKNSTLSSFWFIVAKLAKPL